MNIKKYNETIIGVLANLIPIILIAVVVRMHIKSLGLDDFTANTFFIVIILLGTFIYMVFMSVFENLSQKITKLFYKRVKEKTNKYMEHYNSFNDKGGLLSETKKNKEEKLKVAIEYTRKEFSPYVSSTDLERLLSSITLYFEKGNLDNIKAIEIGKLKTIDIYHFGWNIWNYFKISNQNDLVVFLKKKFPDVLEQVNDDETIKKNLKKDELKGIIKIKESLIDDED